MRRRAMAQDFSWEKSAQKYVALYENARKKLPGASAKDSRLQSP
jgi:glycogen synthase